MLVPIPYGATQLTHIPLLGLLFVNLTVVPAAAAQDRPRAWLGLGVGAGGGHDAAGMGLVGQFVFQKRAHYFAARALYMADLYDTDAIGEVGVLYGRAALRPWGHASIAGGLAYTSIQPCPDSGSTGCTTIGVPVVAEASLRLGSVVGVGAQAFVNLNSQTVYRGLAVFFQLGWMPEH